MFYKPKYCCNCGEEIEKTDWNILSSGRFCDVCRDDFKPQEWLPRILVLGGIVLGLFGFGSVLKPAQEPLNLTTKQIAENSPNQKKEVKDNKLQIAGNLNNQAASNVNSQIAAQNQLPSAKNLSEQKGAISSETKVSAEEQMYFCGAATKKGSPCSRRVKGNARCWQHAGQSAILSSEKLIVSR